MAKTFVIIENHAAVAALGTIVEASYTDNTEFGFGHDASGNVDATNAGKRRITAELTVEFDVATTALPASGGQIALDWDGNGTESFNIEDATRDETADSSEVNTFKISAFFDLPS